jgi:hypothetical protein
MDHNEVLGLKSISKGKEKGMVKQFGYNLNQSWYFEKWYEKLILVGLCVLGVWRIFSWIF